MNKKLWWVHDASNCEYTYLDISPKRGTAGMEQCGVLPEFKGLVMHDCWASYWNYPDVQHAHKFEKKYNELIEQARKENPCSGRTPYEL